MEHVLIIGGGPAAISIARTLQGKKQVTVIRLEPHSMIYCAMPYVLEGIIPANKPLKKDSLVTEAGATLISDSVIRIDFENKCVYTENEKTLSYDKLVITTGADPIMPRIAVTDLGDVLTFQTEDDMMKVAGYLDNGLRKAVVMGTGDIGVELAQALNARGVQTQLVDMEEQILPNLLDCRMVDEAENELTSLGVEGGIVSKLKVAVSIDSKRDITQTHFGDCNTIVFAEISLEGYTVLGRTRYPLTQDNDGDHGDLQKLKTARDLLHEVCILVAG